MAYGSQKLASFAVVRPSFRACRGGIIRPAAATATAARVACATAADEPDAPYRAVLVIYHPIGRHSRLQLQILIERRCKKRAVATCQPCCARLVSPPNWRSYWCCRLRMRRGPWLGASRRARRACSRAAAPAASSRRSRCAANRSATQSCWVRERWRPCWCRRAAQSRGPGAAARTRRTRRVRPALGVSRALRPPERGANTALAATDVANLLRTRPCRPLPQA
jgi:hypothetical protein